MTENSRLSSLLDLLNEDPDDGFLIFAIAKEYEGMENNEKAIAYLNELKEKQADYVGLYYHLAALYVKEEEEEKAMEIYDEGIKIAEKLKDLHALSELKSAKLNLELEM